MRTHRCETIRVGAPKLFQAIQTFIVAGLRVGGVQKVVDVLCRIWIQRVEDVDKSFGLRIGGALQYVVEQRVDLGIR